MQSREILRVVGVEMAEKTNQKVKSTFCPAAYDPILANTVYSIAANQPIDRFSLLDRVHERGEPINEQVRSALASVAQ